MSDGGNGFVDAEHTREPEGATGASQLKRIYPVDDYTIPDEILRYTTRHHFLRVPLIGQHNPVADKSDWCGRTSAVMVWNYYQRVFGNVKSKTDYITHWRGSKGTDRMDFRHPKTEEIVAMLGAWYSPSALLDTVDGMKDNAGFFLLNEVGASERLSAADRIASSLEEQQKVLAPILTALESNNPAVVFTGLSTSQFGGHIIVIAGYGILRDQDGAQKLWLLIADPASPKTSAGPTLTPLHTDPRVALELGALCKKLLDRGYQAALFWEEDDSAKGEAAARNDFSASIVWDVYTKDQKRPWLVGCAPGSTIRSPKFSYPEAWEAGDAFEYSYSLAMQRPAARGPIQRFVTKGERLFSMAWPSLTSFELECRLLPIPFAGVSVPRISAKGLVTGLHKDLSVSMKITLWKATSRWSFQPVGEARVASVEDGFFSTVIYEFPQAKDVCVADPLTHWLIGVSAKNTPEKDAVFFATARFHEAHLANQKLPLGCSLRYDAQVFRPFREATGVLAQASSATACCSREAFMGYTPVGEALRCLGLDHTSK